MSVITFVIFTYNEESRIERVFKNLKDYGKILLADDSSTDRTHEIAKQYGAQIYIREKTYEIAENQELVDLLYGQIDTEWIYWGFADEMLDKVTLDKILEVVKSGKYDIISMERKNYFYGSFCYDLYSARTYKIFKKGTLDFTNNKIHRMGTPTVPAEKIYQMPGKNFVHHFISNTASSYLNIINIYTDTEVKAVIRPKTSILYFFFLILKSVIKSFYYNKGYKAKFAGLSLTELMMFYAIVENMKHFEARQGLNRNTIEELNDVKRSSIINQF